MLRIAGGDFRRPEILAQHALARAGLLDFCDHCGLPRGNFAANCTDEIARRFGQRRFIADLRQRFGSLCRRYFLRLDREDFFQDVRHQIHHKTKARILTHARW